MAAETRFVIRRALSVGLAATLGLSLADAAFAQSGLARWDIGGQVATVLSRQFDAANTGAGGRVSWHPTGLLGVDGELNVYPADFPDQRPFSRGAVEGFFGVTAGVPLGRVRPFARLRPGFVDIRDAPRPLACIAIFPPPLACTLAAGDTRFALDTGGGIEIRATRRTFLRVDVGDRLVRYPAPVFDNQHVVHQQPFFSHDFRLATGAGVRF